MTSFPILWFFVFPNLSSCIMQELCTVSNRDNRETNTKESCTEWNLHYFKYKKDLLLKGFILLLINHFISVFVSLLVTHRAEYWIQKKIPIGCRYFMLNDQSSKLAASLAEAGAFIQIEPKWTLWTSAIWAAAHICLEVHKHKQTFPVLPPSNSLENQSWTLRDCHWFFLKIAG